MSHVITQATVRPRMMCETVFDHENLKKMRYKPPRHSAICGNFVRVLFPSALLSDPFDSAAYLCLKKNRTIS